MTVLRRRSWITPAVVAFAAAGIIILVGGGRNMTVLALAVITGVAFGDLTRRALHERSGNAGDVTDVLTSLAFFLVLVGGSYDTGRDTVGISLPTWELSLRIAGMALILFGIGLRRSAAWALGSSFLVRLGTRPEQSLVRSGPYRVLRHPNYCGLLAVALGTAASLESGLALAAALVFWLPSVILRINREEQLMSDRFGDAYRNYAARTWRLVPGLY